MKTITVNQFIQASEKGNVSIVKKYILEDSDVDIQDEDGYTALILASYKGHTETIELLLNAGADVNLQDKYGNTALICASYNGHKETVDILDNINLYKLRKKLNVDSNKTLKNSNIF